MNQPPTLSGKRSTLSHGWSVSPKHRKDGRWTLILALEQLAVKTNNWQLRPGGLQQKFPRRCQLAGWEKGIICRHGWVCPLMSTSADGPHMLRSMHIQYTLYLHTIYMLTWRGGGRSTKSVNIEWCEVALAWRIRGTGLELVSKDLTSFEVRVRFPATCESPPG